MDEMRGGGLRHMCKIVHFKPVVLANTIAQTGILVSLPIFRDNALLTRTCRHTSKLLGRLIHLMLSLVYWQRLLLGTIQIFLLHILFSNYI